jgi:alpha-tubulin suppressor-like RCC1 family protein
MAMRHDDLARMLPRLRPWRWLATALLLLGLGGSWLVAPGQAATGPVRTPTALGTILAWGSDHAGQLGDGTVEAPDNWPVPQPVPGFDNVVAVSTGAQFSLALRADGSVWAWGYDGVGQLGDGTVGSPPAQPTPQPVPGIADAVAIAAGGFHSLALRADGTVWAWGYDEYAQLGDGIVGGPNAQPAPRQVPGLTNVVAVSAGILVSLALTDDGTIWAWGIDFAASLDAGRRFQPTLQPVAGLRSFVDVGRGTLIGV